MEKAFELVTAAIKNYGQALNWCLIIEVLKLILKRPRKKLKKKSKCPSKECLLKHKTVLSGLKCSENATKKKK